MLGMEREPERTGREGGGVQGKKKGLEMEQGMGGELEKTNSTERTEREREMALDTTNKRLEEDEKRVVLLPSIKFER